MKAIILILALTAIGATLTASEAATEALMRESQCFACHAVDKKLVGPAYRAVARKYRGKPGAVAKLVKKVEEGGSGVWGSAVMTPHHQLTDAQAKAMVLWVLQRK
jgi:cytochrome c